jgi:RimJ/RimL family protein N-acetyltransferase
LRRDRNMSDIEHGPDAQKPLRQPLEFEADGNLLLKELMESDSRALLRFKNENPELEKTLPQFKALLTESDALEMIEDKRFSTFAMYQDSLSTIAGLMTWQQEEKHRVSIGYCIGKNFRRQGIAKRGITKMVDIFFKTPDITTVRAYVAADNTPSRRLLERCGFHLQGERPHVHVFYDLDKDVVQQSA